MGIRFVSTCLGECENLYRLVSFKEEEGVEEGSCGLCVPSARRAALTLFPIRRRLTWDWTTVWDDVEDFGPK